MNRVDVLYTFPHKGLRNALSQLSFQAGSTNYGDQQELDDLKQISKEIVLLLDLHMRSEEDILLPALELRVPGSTEGNHEEHEHLGEKIKRFEAMLNEILITPPRSNGASFYLIYNDFHSMYIAHMAMLETKINDLIWANFTDEEMMKMHGQIMASLTLEQIMMWFKYIVPALDFIERSVIMGGLKAYAPAEFFESVINMLKEHMSESAHLQLEAMLS